MFACSLIPNTNYIHIPYIVNAKCFLQFIVSWPDDTDSNNLIDVYIYKNYNVSIYANNITYKESVGL